MRSIDTLKCGTGAYATPVVSGKHGTLEGSLYRAGVAVDRGGVGACGVLGSVTVRGAPVSSSRQRRVLAALVIAEGGVVSTDRLADLVWDGEPPDTANALQTYVSRLRGLLGSEAIVRRPPGYALALPVDEVDAWRFEALVAEARGRSPSEALAVLDEALALWRGPAYAEFADADFARPEAVRLQELRASTATARLDALLDLGRPDDAAAEAVALIEADPYRESGWARRMRGLHAAGRTVEAIRVFHEYRELLAAETGLVPSSDLAALERALVASQPVEAGAVPDGLPTPLTTLIGREAVRDELVGMVADHRVVTLVGPPGVGKTRLAVEVARVHRDRSGWPATLVELAPAEADGVVAAVARNLDVALGVDPIGLLRRALAERRVLLVVDNCEHVVEDVAELVEALAPFCPGLRVLATSRVRLGVTGERVWVVPPLAVPDPDQVEKLGDLEGWAATRLFLDRAATGGGVIDDQIDSVRAVARICLAVDGLPLGVELAAARTRELPLDHIGAGLVSGTGGAVPAKAAHRHRSLDAAIGWSYQLLAPGAQRVLWRLAVFEGGWTLDAAEVVCASDNVDAAAVPGMLAGLVAASLVTFEPTAERYGMLETVRDFARARLVEAGETASVCDAHLRWCRQLADAVVPKVFDVVPADLLDRLTVERPNLQAALRAALVAEDHHDDAISLAHDLIAFWITINGGRDVTGLIDEILDLPTPITLDRAELTLAAGILAEHMDDRQRASRRYKEALALARTVDDRGALCRCLMQASRAVDDDTGVTLINEAKTIAEQLEEPDLRADVAAELGLRAERAGRYDEAVTLYHEILGSGANLWYVVEARHRLARIHEGQGRWREARDHLLTVEKHAAELRDRAYAGDVCVKLALVELAAGDVDRARSSYERASVWGRPTDDYETDQLVFDAAGALLRAETGDLATATARARTLARLPNETVYYADICDPWLIIGEILARSGDRHGARQLFRRVLCHRGGSFPRYRAAGLEAMAGTLGDDQRPAAITLAAAAAALRSRHGLVTPPWLTVAATGAQHLTAAAITESALMSVNDDEAVGLALSLDGL
jgi:predicted ATPase/DNA-binding SARP family transcriptional activator